MRLLRPTVGDVLPPRRKSDGAAISDISIANLFAYGSRRRLSPVVRLRDLLV